MVQIAASELRSLVKTVKRLDEEVGYLRDRQQILDCIARYTRAVDRHDWKKIPSVYHADGIANHGDWVGYWSDFEPWLGPTLVSRFRSHMHTILNHNCEIKGDVAHAETYAIVFTHMRNADIVNMLGARYIDQFEKRNGVWKIALRRIIGEWRVPVLANVVPNFPVGSWDKKDLSFMRTLDLTPQLKRQLKATSKGPKKQK